jgi:phosphoadenosine phosphosulfate reductase
MEIPVKLTQALFDQAAEARAIIAEQLARAAAPCITSSFQAESMVLLHMFGTLQPDIPVLFVDTWHHFAETQAYRGEIVHRWKLNLITLKSETPSPGLWKESTDACCARHKVRPLFDALAGYDTWFSGLRREQSPTRASLCEVAPFKLPGGVVLTKVSPLARWTTGQVWEYAKVHDLPLLPLYAQGYTSIGCAPCTSLPLNPGNERSGRWGGHKLECGIHIEGS